MPNGGSITIADGTSLQDALNAAGAAAQAQATGYTCSAWDKDGSAFSLSTPISEPVTLTAVCTINSYRVTFQLEGGTGGDTAEQNITYQNTATEPATNPSKTGRTFVRWSAVPNGTAAFDFAGTPIEQNTVIYAVWNINTYTLTLHKNAPGGETVANFPAPPTVTAEYDTSPAAPTSPTTEHYDFIGWFDAATGGNQFVFGSSKVTADDELYARWQGKLYTVTFHANGGTGGAPSKSTSIGNKISAPSGSELPTKAGHSLKEWNTKQDGSGTAFNFASTSIEQDITLCAQWQAATYTVTFNVDGNTSTVATQDIAYNGYATEPSPPSKNGGVLGVAGAASGGR